jgi:hypothetical protein
VAVRRTARILALLIVAFAVVTLRVVAAGELAIAASDAALRAGDPREAVTQAGRAAGLYAPGAPHVDVAYLRLKALAQAAEEHKRTDLSLLAWRSIRIASRETRWLITPHAADADEADRAIARLMARQGEDPEQQERIAAQQLQQLATSERPRLMWVLVLIASFVSSVVGLWWFARAAAGVSGTLEWSAARLPAAITLAGVALYLLALWRA